MEEGRKVEEGRDGREERSEYCLPLGSPVCISLRSTPFFKTTTFMEVVSNWEGAREGGREGGRENASCCLHLHGDKQLNSLPQEEWSRAAVQRQ